MQRIRCPVCGSGEFASHWDCDEFRFVRCRGCGHLCQNPQPLAADVRQRYDREYFDYERENDRAFLNLMLLGLRDVAYERWLFDLPRPLRVLDIGCATGALLEFFAGKHGSAVQGVEVCAPAARYGIERRGIPIHIGTLEEAAFPAEEFSLVHFSHVIEHIPDPRGFLSEVFRILASGGRAVVVTPDTAGLQARVFGRRWRSAIADHLHLFSRRGLARLLRDCGFSIVDQAYWGGLAQGSVPEWVKRPVDRAAKRFRFGDVMLLLAERPSDAAASSRSLPRDSV